MTAKTTRFVRSAKKDVKAKEVFQIIYGWYTGQQRKSLVVKSVSKNLSDKLTYKITKNHALEAAMMETKKNVRVVKSLLQSQTGLAIEKTAPGFRKWKNK